MVKYFSLRYKPGRLLPKKVTQGQGLIIKFHYIRQCSHVKENLHIFANIMQKPKKNVKEQNALGKERSSESG